jgi:hypothetical protein
MPGCPALSSVIPRYPTLCLCYSVLSLSVPRYILALVSPTLPSPYMVLAGVSHLLSVCAGPNAFAEVVLAAAAFLQPSPSMVAFPAPYRGAYVCGRKIFPFHRTCAGSPLLGLKAFGGQRGDCPLWVDCPLGGLTPPGLSFLPVGLSAGWRGEGPGPFGARSSFPPPSLSRYVDLLSLTPDPFRFCSPRPSPFHGKTFLILSRRQNRTDKGRSPRARGVEVALSFASRPWEIG